MIYYSSSSSCISWNSHPTIYAQNLRFEEYETVIPNQKEGDRFSIFAKQFLRSLDLSLRSSPPQKHWISRNHCNLWKDSASQNQNLGHFKLNPDRLYIQYQVTQVTTWQPSWKMLSVKDKIARDSGSMEWRAHRPFPRPLRQQAQFWIHNRHQVKIY